MNGSFSVEFYGNPKSALQFCCYYQKGQIVLGIKIIISFQGPQFVVVPAPSIFPEIIYEFMCFIYFGLDRKV